MEVVASLSQGRTAAAQCGLFTHKSVPVIFEPPCILVSEPGYCRQHSDKARGWKNLGSNPKRGKRFISSPQLPVRLLGPTSVVSGTYVVLRPTSLFRW